MFLIDSGLAAQDWQKMIDEIQRVMDRAGAEVVSLKKWDERRMAYEVQGKVRGLYILVYFNCDPEKVKGIERDVQLSEQLIRVMILRGDRMSQTDIEKATPAETAVVETPPAKTEPAEAAPAEDAVETTEAVEAVEAAPVEEAGQEAVEDAGTVDEDVTKDDGSSEEKVV